MEWKDKYPKNIKPAYNELLEYFSDNIRKLFLCFNEEMNNKFGVWIKWCRYEKTVGWVYGYGRLYRVELLFVVVQSDCFYVLDVAVKDEVSLQNALEKQTFT